MAARVTSSLHLTSLVIQDCRFWAVRLISTEMLDSVGRSETSYFITIFKGCPARSVDNFVARN